MTPTLRKTLAVLLGVVALALMPMVAFWLTGEIAPLFRYEEGVPSKFGENAIYKRFGDVYARFAVLGLSIAAASAVTLFVWPGTNATWRSKAVFGVLLAVALPLSVLNYWGRDSYTSRSSQALVDLVLVLLSTIAAINIAQLRATESPTIAVRGLALFFIVFQGVLMPATYGTLWLLNWQGAVTKAASESLAPGWISALCAIGSMAVSTFQYLLARKKQDSEASVHRPFRAKRDRDA